MKHKQLFYYLIKKEMKKLVLMAAVLFSVSIATVGCGSKSEAADSTDSVDSAAVEVVDTVAADTVAADSVAADSVKA